MFETQTDDGVEHARPADDRTVRELVHDLAALVELQGQLIAVDANACLRQALVPSLVVLTGFVLTSGCVTTGAIGMALLVAQTTGWTYGTAFLVTGTVGACMGSLVVAAAGCQLRRCLAVLDRSRNELAKNLAWIKGALRHGRRSWPF